MTLPAEPTSAPAHSTADSPAPVSSAAPAPGDAPPAHAAGAPAQQPSYLGRIIVGGSLTVLLAAVAVWMLWSRRTAAAATDAVRQSGEVARGSVVRVASVGLSPTVRHVDLIGEARPFQSVTLYAKVAGYLKTVRVDVGDRVDSGAVIATIESPETDRALLAAKADYDNKRVNADRISQLLERKLVSPQEVDQARTEAAVAEQRLEGLREQQAYETLRAPFGGRVTARFADPGALAQSAATSQTNALPVVTVSNTDSLRVTVYLDQADAAAARRGTPAEVTFAERPNVRIPASVARVSGQLDPKTRKMLSELDIANRQGEIVPGSFVQVRVDLPAAAQPQAPAEALLIRGGQTYVGTIDDQSRVHLQPVVVASNDGRMVTFSRGVDVGARVALNLGSAVAEGDRVQIDTGKTGARAAAQ